MGSGSLSGRSDKKCEEVHCQGGQSDRLGEELLCPRGVTYYGKSTCTLSSGCD
jgi:hypothetical protein